MRVTLLKLTIALCVALHGVGSSAFAKPEPARRLMPDAARDVAQRAVADILDALASSDFKRLASHVGREGLVLSPYVMIDADDVQLSRTEVERCREDVRVRVWGYRDGSGDAIETACRGYFAEFVWDADYRRADEVLYNTPRQRGLEPNNNHEFAHDVIVAEFHIRETPEGAKPYRPWKSLRLLFRHDDQGLSLIAITRDVRTI
ncbi:hypothetical protein [Microvirga aerophila]|uniref:Lipoprotein n=1 Tax=Microvirga aerophila TaxID=670291 RepID=A0A512BQN5_9HYPH|nr:hypothetical protein [Microvirga aerophila]GEO14241.1 hypothetical protein MAE02_19370 [Microvirga aerophila]